MAAVSEALVVRDGRLATGPFLMGVVNATPDSFSDGGGDAVALARTMAANPDVAIIDVGGESTRPGAVALSADEEIARVMPVLAAIRGRVVSIDTTKAAVAEVALAAGAQIINDVSGGVDPTMLRVVARARCTIILGHMRGTPATMNELAYYDDVVKEARDELGARITAAIAAGIAPQRIWIDPGIGFAKKTEHNVALLARLGELRVLGHPIVVGASRKRFLGALGGGGVHEREEATAAAHAIAIWNGADVVRVHDVTRQAGAIRVAQAITRDKPR